MTRSQTWLSVLALGVLLVAAVVISNASIPTTNPQGVVLLQFGCTFDPNNGRIPGPLAVPVGSSGSCGLAYYLLGPFASPVPGGNLYHLRVNPSVATLDGTTPNVQITVYDGNAPTPLTCNTTGSACQDLTHQFIVKSGDVIWINVSLPDSNTYLNWTTATIEESVFR